jgi:uncharacterized membrane protein
MTTSEKSSTGLDANLASALSYVFGLVSGVIFFAIETQSRVVKYHALQSMLVSVAAMVVYIAYGVLWAIMSRVPVLGWVAGIFGFFGWALLMLGFFALWVYCLVKAFNGERFKLPYLGEIAEQQIWPTERR